MAFRSECVRLSIDKLIPLKVVTQALKQSKKYRQIVSSLSIVGPVQPPVVRSVQDYSGRYYLLDGHLLIEAHKDLGITEVDCLVATNDDTYTYNKRVNRLALIQEHKMILRALDRGVSEEKMAKALGLSLASIRRRAVLVNDVCVEAVELLGDQPCPAGVFPVLRKMKPARQVESVNLMIGQNNYSVSFATAMLAATHPSDLSRRQIKRVNGVPTKESMEQMERELSSLQEQIKTTDKAYGEEILQLATIKAYLLALLTNASIVKWLARHNREYLEEFQKIAELPALAARIR